MTKTKRVQPTLPDVPFAELLSLFSKHLFEDFVTFSVYTSKAGRIWLNFKSWQPHTYSTAVECQHHGSTLELLDALAIALVSHYSKVHMSQMQVDTWLPLKERGDAAVDANQWLCDFYTITALSPDTQDSAPDLTADTDAEREAEPDN